MKLAKITEQNIYDVMALKLKSDQNLFVRDPLFSLAESYYYRNDDTVLLFALEEQGKVVGFLSLITEIEKQTVYIWRIMIGGQYQSKGYGRKALRVIEEYIHTLEGYEKIVSDYAVGNLAMKHLLETEGYVETGKQDDWNEVVMTKKLVR
ncbi:GNAT family N-acetyltransferase [Facklamia sp. 7083-14-GEN3]|uniref:GNAT family N-acetyltransferase n=1 Tax=Facklamia sp. 7083-14-GEN3 TaxID=2973478 RepID=UPI00215CEA66|nr:GNAT family N-acetyltransferase [Facklamia sp. 7083-14-GEN3]MCR8968431.1 GNAT family N-acetyltransferase [Facklamia sp. 7083-14-GEN3]